MGASHPQNPGDEAQIFVDYNGVQIWDSLLLTLKVLIKTQFNSELQKLLLKILETEDGYIKSPKLNNPS